MDKRFVAVIILALIVYFCNLGGNSVYILDEAKNAECAREMMARGDLVVPTFNGDLRTDKPVLHYYFMMISYAVFGVSAFGARFFSAVCGVLLVVVVYRGVQRILNSDVAFFSSLILLGSVQLAVQFHLAVPDPYLILFMTICLFSFFYGYHFDRRYLLLCYASSALGFLTKGIIAAALPGLIVFIYLITIKELRWSLVYKLRLAQGILIFFLVSLPWYLAVWFATKGEWIRGFFIDHNLQRYTTTMEGHHGFPLAPFVILLVALLPFSVFILQAVHLAIKEWQQYRFLSFCLTVCAVISIFFSFSKTILPSYPAPAIPFLAIIMGHYVSRLEIDSLRVRPGVRISLVVNFFICAALPIAGYWFLDADAQTEGISYVAAIFLVLPIGSLLGGYYFQKGKISSMIYSWTASWILLVVMFFYWAYPKIDQMNPVTQSIPMITQLKETHHLVGYRRFNPAFIFQLESAVPVINSVDELNVLLSKNRKVMVITRYQYLEDFRRHDSLKIIFRAKDLFERTETVVLAN